MDVLLVAAKKDKIGDYTSVITQAGRTPVVVDVDAFALQNAYEANYGFEAGGVIALLNAGASATNINILHGAQSVFTRDVSMGGNAFTEAVQRELGLPYELAEQLKKGYDVDGATYDDARPVLKAMTDNVLLEVEKTFDFFKATASSDRIDRIVLSGGASRVDGFANALGDTLRQRSRRPSTRSARCRSTRPSWEACPWRRWHPSRRWPSASRCGRWATDDSHQPPRGRAPAGQVRAQGPAAGAEDDRRRQPDPGPDGARPRLALLGPRPDGDGHRARAERCAPRRAAARRHPQASRTVRGAARTAPAARHA